MNLAAWGVILRARAKSGAIDHTVWPDSLDIEILTDSHATPRGADSGEWFYHAGMTNAAQTPQSETGDILCQTDLNLPGRRGKVRDVYRLPPASGSGAERILLIATDRISAFDVVLPTAIPEKGRLLTGISEFWLQWIEQQGLARTHLISVDPADIPAEAFTAGTHGQGTTSPDLLRGRMLIGQACKVVPIECIVRGYIEGSGLKEYRATGSICGIKLPEGLQQCDKLPEPIFTPTTKAEPPAHDESVTFEEACNRVGTELMTTLRDISLAMYKTAAEYALKRGIIIADTKFEFGHTEDGDLVVIDEVFTPDSSRFWPADEYEPGHAQPSFDKQYVREHLEGLVARSEWDKSEPGPELPRAVVEGTLSRYREAVSKLRGNPD